MKQAKFIFVIALVFCCMIPLPLYLIEGMTYETESNLNCPYSELNKITDLVNEKTICIDKTINHLYWEFKDYNESFETIQLIARDQLNDIQEEYQLEDFDVDYWQEYYEAFRDKYTELGMLENKDLKILHQFFTVCENHEINSQIMRLYNRKTTDKSEIAYLLPYTSPVIAQLKNKQLDLDMIQQRGMSKLSSAIDYAKKYATSPNTAKYNYYKGNDCTNFVSQILVAGGYSTNSDWKPYTSKWNTAHNFVLYWYVKLNANNGYPSFNSMSGSLKAGNVIAADWDKDGRYNHCAFVVASGSKTSKGYYDVTIAQHSSNYCAKVSSSTNNWENQTSGTYVRLPF